MNASEAQAAVNAIPYPLDMTEKNRQNYYAAVSTVEAEFRATLEERLTPGTSRTVADAVYGLASRYGHANGYEETANFYLELAELANTVRANS